MIDVFTDKFTMWRCRKCKSTTANGTECWASSTRFVPLEEYEEANEAVNSLTKEILLPINV